jgi:hypothetical protein
MPEQPLQKFAHPGQQFIFSLQFFVLAQQLIASFGRLDQQFTCLQLSAVFLFPPKIVHFPPLTHFPQQLHLESD